MAQKQIYVDGVGEVTLARRRGTRNLRLTINDSGKVRVGLPYWTPEAVAIQFVKKKKSWIGQHQANNPAVVFVNGMRIGKSHTLHFLRRFDLKTASYRIDKIGVYVSSPFEELDERVQRKARRACEQALSAEAKVLLPQRLASLADKYGYTYRNLRIKKLTSRWGSCSQHNVISLSYYLMQLPWQFIDFVILHELVHTKHLNHSPAFWHELDRLSPDAKQTQKQMRLHRPRIEPWTDLI